MRWSRSVSVVLAGSLACTTAEPTQPTQPTQPRPEPAAAEPPSASELPAAEAAPEPAAEPAAEAEAAVDPASTSVPADARIVMQRSGCYGACPAYLVQLTADGTVEWDGRKHVRTKGKASGSLSTEAFAELWRALEASPLAELPERDADIDTRRCPRLFSDSPTIVVTLESGGEERRVHDYQGCEGNAELDAFRELEARIDTVAGTRAWISP